ncbi:MAG: nitrite reductase small subunit [Rubrobacteraceae bacterium]|jgi:nitrite reductase (NADH) small subunit|nr:nitrite reductase small subunit [Rubrobacteraceae bacterium]
MSGWVEICTVEDVPRLEGRRVVVNGFYVAIFNTEEGFFAIGEVCPHMGGPLSDGDVAATTVSCPLHARKIELRTGEVQNDDLSRVLTFPVKVENGKVLMDAGVLYTQPEIKEEGQDKEEDVA